ncbi:MAG TPA: glycosyltransferase, partial [Dokdonella sp.]|nr:glycosyltransferase [Dokdonella sp.]HQW77729.1 glycosyltransferase [Dokdonella sp.]
MPPEIDVTVVVPVFGGSDALAELHQRLAASMTKAGLSWELILVDDRGRPQSWPAIRSLANNFQEVIGLRL